MDKFNILYIENFGDIFGGGQRSLLGFLENCDRDRFSPLIVCPYEGRLAASLREIDIDVRIINMPPLSSLRLFALCKAILQLKRLIKEERIDLVHANGSRAAFYGGMAAKKERIPLIWHVRIVDSDGLWDRFLASLATRIITVSDAVNRRFGWMRDRQSKVKTIYNGIDLIKFDPNSSGKNIRSEFGISPQAPLVGTVGRLDYYKGHKYLLKAARKVVDSIPACRFLIVGDGEKRKELESLTTKLKLGNNVIFAGHREDIRDILAGLDLFVLPSVSEGLGRSIIEAMAIQKSVVATDTGGVPEVVVDRETGVLVPPRNSEALARAIIELLGNKEISLRMGLAARKLAEDKFDIRINVKNIQNLYQELCK